MSTVVAHAHTNNAVSRTNSEVKTTEYQPPDRAAEFIKAAKKASEGSFGLNLIHFRNLYDPEDLSQEAAVWLSNAGLIDEVGERLTRLTMSRCSISLARRMQAQSRGYKRVYSECNLPRNLSGETDLTNAPTPSHEAEMDEQDEMATFMARVRVALSFINPNDAQALKMRFIDGMTVREIAKALGATIEAIDCRVRRGLKAIKEYRDEIGGDSLASA